MNPSKEIITFLAASTIVVFVLLSSVFFLLSSYRKRRKMFMQETLLQKIEYEKNILLAETEVQNSILNQISHELHDTVGQQLTLLYLQAQNLAHEVEDEKLKHTILTQADTLQNSLNNIRNISRLLNTDTVKKWGFGEIIKLELERISQSGICQTEYNNTGSRYLFSNSNGDAILTGLCREFIQNSLKHSKATLIGVHIQSSEKGLHVFCFDNGIGLPKRIAPHKGQGLQNIKKRIEMLGATCQWGSQDNKGTTLTIQLIS